MEKIVEFCVFCEKNQTDLNCDLCGKLICNNCLKSFGLYLNLGDYSIHLPPPKNDIFELNLCPKCNNKMKKNFSIKYGTKKDIQFLKDIETKMRTYFKDRFKTK